MRNQVNIVIVNSPNKQNYDGSFSRATTRDTIACWLELKPSNGSCVAISDQPHILYQQSVLTTYLPESLPITTIGPAITEDITCAEIFDALARFLFQERLRLKLLGARQAKSS